MASDSKMTTFDGFMAPNAEMVGEPGVGVTIYVDETNIGGTWLCWSETLELHAWLTKLVETESDAKQS